MSSFCLGKVTYVSVGNKGTEYEYANIVLDCTKTGEAKRFGAFLGNPRKVVVHCMSANGYSDVIDEINRYGESAFVGDTYRIDLESYQDNGRYGIEYYPCSGSAARFENVPNADPNEFGINTEGIHKRMSAGAKESDSCIGF